MPMTKSKPTRSYSSGAQSGTLRLLSGSKRTSNSARGGSVNKYTTLGSLSSPYSPPAFIKPMRGKSLATKPSSLLDQSPKPLKVLPYAAKPFEKPTFKIIPPREAQYAPVTGRQTSAARIERQHKLVSEREGGATSLGPTTPSRGSVGGSLNISNAKPCGTEGNGASVYQRSKTDVSYLAANVARSTSSNRSLSSSGRERSVMGSRLDPLMAGAASQPRSHSRKGRDTGSVGGRVIAGGESLDLSGAGRYKNAERCVRTYSAPANCSSGRLNTMFSSAPRDSHLTGSGAIVENSRFSERLSQRRYFSSANVSSDSRLYRETKLLEGSFTPGFERYEDKVVDHPRKFKGCIRGGNTDEYKRKYNNGDIVTNGAPMSPEMYRLSTKPQSIQCSNKTNSESNWEEPSQPRKSIRMVPPTEHFDKPSGLKNCNSPLRNVSDDLEFNRVGSTYQNVPSICNRAMVPNAKNHTTHILNGTSTIVATPRFSKVVFAQKNAPGKLTEPVNSIRSNYPTNVNFRKRTLEGVIVATPFITAPYKGLVTPYAKFV